VRGPGRTSSGASGFPDAWDDANAVLVVGALEAWLSLAALVLVERVLRDLG
jgi:hypothetical protein